MQKLLQQSTQIKSELVSGVNLAQKGNFLKALSVKREKSKDWIVDSSASNHASLFSYYSPCFGDFTIRIADGSLPKVAGTRSVVVSKDIIFKSILYVPNLDCNILSASKITRDLKCVTKFFSHV